MPYIPNTDADRRRMLDSIGAKDVAELFDTIPDDLCLKQPLDLPDPLSEIGMRSFAAELSRKNANLDDYVSFLGAGVYDHYIPSTVPAVLGRSELYTAYTPYQPELSQGNLQSIFEFQTLICELTGMEVANASMYDGASALAEAALMATSITGRMDWVVSECVHPAYRQTMSTFAWASGCRLVEVEATDLLTSMDALAGRVNADTACVIIQSPNFFGAIEPLMEVGRLAHSNGALFIVSFDPISLGLLKPPGEFDADICVGEGQGLGISTGFGGPLLGLFACKKQYVRQMPGRIVGATTDTQGRRGYTLTLQTREQHIRRERATSNICTNQALCALAATVYLATLGKQGLRQVAELCLQKSRYAAERFAQIPGCELPYKSKFVKEFVVKHNHPIEAIDQKLRNKKMLGGLDLGQFYPRLSGHALYCVTEMRTRAQIDSLVEALTP